MENKNKFHSLIKNLNRPLQCSLIDIVAQNESLLPEPVDGDFFLDELRLNIERYLANWEFSKNYDDEKNYLELYRISLLLKLENLRIPLNNPGISNNERFEKVYQLGVYSKELNEIDQKIEALDANKILSRAKQLWQEGDKRVRKEIAQYLQDISSDFSYDKLQGKLASLVEKCGKMRNRNDHRPGERIGLSGSSV